MNTNASLAIPKVNFSSIAHDLTEGPRHALAAHLEPAHGRRANTPPIGWTDAYIDPAYAEIGEIVRASPGVLISALIEARYGRCIAEIRQDVCALTVGDTDISRALGLTPGQAALKIVRRYFDASGHVFEVSVTVHPAERFSLSMRLQR
ncbi:GntR family transcriptional regulator [Cupriavidus basilensis OR16]|uniref:GntR family transcriptional regulator n=1 Tax=Cupriavidus basilensis OR16 TaxID=1127483 RepID=H1S452_9BURK|nr:UTRA domain-containing protein [Cupriavidus basilensis]EHP42691.1 GntR family transcriptional regulator [Cupriavidus basilensis OR16]